MCITNCRILFTHPPPYNPHPACFFFFFQPCRNGWGLQTNFWFISTIAPFGFMLIMYRVYAEFNFKSFPPFFSQRRSRSLARSRWTTHKCKCLAEHQLFLSRGGGGGWRDPGKVKMIKKRPRQERKKSFALAWDVFCLIVCSFATAHSCCNTYICTAVNTQVCCQFPKRSGGGFKKKSALLEGELELSFTTLQRLYPLPFFFLISSSRADHVELITQNVKVKVFFFYWGK